MIKLNLLTNVKALQFFHLARQGTAILIAILLAKSTLSTAEIGTYEMLNYIGFLTSFFWTSGLMQGMLGLYPRLEVEKQRLFVFNAYLVFSALSSIIFLILFLFRHWALLALAHQPELDYFDIFLLFSLVNLPAFLLENYYLLHEKPLQLYYWACFSFGLQLVVVLVPVFLGYGLQMSFYGLTVLGALKWLWLTVFTLRNGTWKIDRPLISKWFSVAVPLVLYALISAINQSYDSWLVGYFFKGDEPTFALFRYGARELPMVIAMSNAFSAAMVPAIAKNLEQGLYQVKEKSKKLFHLLFPASIALMFGSHWLFPLVFSPAFNQSIPVFNIFLLITISRLVFSRTVLVGLQDNRVILLISLLEFLVHIVAGLAFGGRWGLIGIAGAALLAYSLEKVLICVYLYYRHGIRLSAYTPMRWYILYSTLLFGAFLFNLFL